MSNLTCYYDASGNRADPNVRFLFVAGFIATEYKWLRFEPVWKEFVGRCGMEHFRMSTFWQQWRERPKERAALVREGARIIRRFTRKGFSAGVDLSIHREMAQTYRLPPAFESPLVLAGVQAVRSTLHHLAITSEGQQRFPLFLFENGDLDKGKLMDALALWDKSLVPSFGEKADHPGIQAGDFLAWHHARMLARRPMEIDPIRVFGSNHRRGDDAWVLCDRAWYEKHTPKWEKRT